MGYYTEHEIELELANEDTKEAIVEALREKGVIDYAFDKDLDCFGECKWYDQSKDMKEISKEFPNTLFTIKMKGECGAIGAVYYLNGSEQDAKAIIVYEECKLK